MLQEGHVSKPQSDPPERVVMMGNRHLEMMVWQFGTAVVSPSDTRFCSPKRHHLQGEEVQELKFKSGLTGRVPNLH